jgi:hypothetical protein
MEEQQADRSLDFAHFVRLVLDALDALQLKYLVGGAVAVWAWGEVRTTRDLDLVIELPVEAIADLSRELAQRDMLVTGDRASLIRRRETEEDIFRRDVLPVHLAR